MKIKFSKKQKKGMLITVVVVGITGAFVYSKFSGTSGGSDITAPESTSTNNRSSANELSNTGPDVESLIDASSPIAESAQEAEEREAEETKASGESYIGDVFITQGEADRLIEIPSFIPEPEPEPEPEPIKIPRQQPKQENTGKRAAEITLEDISRTTPRAIGFNVGSMVGNRGTELVVNSGSLTTFVEYDDSEDNEGSRKNDVVIQESNLNNMFEASSPSYMKNNNVKNERLKVTLGSKFYSTIGFAINSDDNGPALATIHEGPLKGAKLQGSYVLNQLSKAVNISFNRMSFKGETYNINAIGYDLENERPVLADDVNNRRLERYGGLFLAAFVQGYAETLQDTTTTTNDNGDIVRDTSAIEEDRDRLTYALSKPAEEIANQLRANINRPITVYVNNGRGVGIYFLDDIVID